MFGRAGNGRLGMVDRTSPDARRVVILIGIIVEIKHVADNAIGSNDLGVNVIRKGPSSRRIEKSLSPLLTAIADPDVSATVDDVVDETLPTSAPP